MATQGKKVKTKKKEKKNVPHGIAFINATFNNTLVTFTEPNGNVLSWSSSGAQGFKGSKKSTPFASQIAAAEAGKKAKDHGIRSVDVRVKGPGAGREAAIRAIQSIGIRVNAIKDVTPIPHNGCRPPKRRRV
ncbi:MAG: 30S ribosomal protein S11 [Bdellovibrionota bacterium]